MASRRGLRRGRPCGGGCRGKEQRQQRERGWKPSERGAAEPVYLDAPGLPRLETGTTGTAQTKEIMPTEMGMVTTTTDTTTMTKITIMIAAVIGRRRIGTMMTMLTMIMPIVSLLVESPALRRDMKRYIGVQE